LGTAVATPRRCLQISCDNYTAGEMCLQRYAKCTLCRALAWDWLRFGATNREREGKYQRSALVGSLGVSLNAPNLRRISSEIYFLGAPLSD
jgi:hypothetical protein